jgi:hypothetical protein
MKHYICRRIFHTGKARATAPFATEKLYKSRMYRRS